MIADGQLREGNDNGTVKYDTLIYDIRSSSVIAGIYRGA